MILGLVIRKFNIGACAHEIMLKPTISTIERRNIFFIGFYACAALVMNYFQFILSVGHLGLGRKVILPHEKVVVVHNPAEIVVGRIIVCQ